MSIRDLLGGSISVMTYQFIKYYDNEMYDRAAYHILFSLETCIRLIEKPVLRFLLENGRNEIISAIFAVFYRNRFDISSVIDSDDFLLACRTADAGIVAMFAAAGAKIEPMTAESETSPLQILLNRDDVDLIVKCIELIPELLDVQHSRVYPFEYIIMNDNLVNLRAQISILLLLFCLEKDAIREVAMIWVRKWDENTLPHVLSRVYKSYINDLPVSILVNRRKMRGNEVFPPAALQDHRLPDAMKIFEEAHEFNRYLDTHMQFMDTEDAYNFELDETFDEESQKILFDLPNLLLRDSEMMCRRHLYLAKSLKKDDAVGEGPVETLFATYFRQIEIGSHFSRDNALLLLPAGSFSDADPEGTTELEKIFYGLGVVMLKSIIDKRNIGAVGKDNTDDKNLSHVHIKLFEALLRDITEPESITRSTVNEIALSNMEWLNGQIVDNPNAYSVIEVWAKEYLYGQDRRRIYKAIRKGFTLSPTDEMSPEVKQAMKQSQNKLSGFYSKIKTLSPAALNFLVVGLPRFTYEMVEKTFSFYVNKSMAGLTGGVDEEMDLDLPENEKYKIMFEHSKTVIQKVLRAWCEDEKQKNIREFMNFLHGTTGSSMFNRQRFVKPNGSDTEFTFIFLVDTHGIMVWGCDGTIRSQFYESEEECERIWLGCIAEWRSNPHSFDLTV